MNKLSKQDLDICYALSKAFDYYTQYDDYLDEFKEAKKQNAEFFALLHTRRKYENIKKEILNIKPKFSKNDFERLFTITASYCLANPKANEFSWCVPQGWEKDELQQGIKNLKCSQKLAGHLLFILSGFNSGGEKNHKKIFCHIFGFKILSRKHFKKLLKSYNFTFSITQMYIIWFLIIVLSVVIYFAFFAIKAFVLR